MVKTRKTAKNKWLSAGQLRRRSLAVTLCFTILLGMLCGRVAYIQLIKGGEYQKLATNQQTRTRTISAKRGTIYDRNGKTLAISATVYRVSINPRDIRNDENYKDIDKHQKYVAQKLAEILVLEYVDVYKKVTENNAYQEIKRKVEEETAEKLRKWINDKDEKIFGVYIDEDSKRYYPNNSLAAHVIGFTGVDDQGLAGIESLYDSELKGTNGYILSEVDAKGRSLPLTEEVRVAPQNGNDVILTIDETIQYLAEKSINQTIKDVKVLEGAACIVMNPNTGEILAMASNPTFNLNEPFAYPEDSTGVLKRKLVNEVRASDTSPTGIEGYDDRDKWTGKTQTEIDVLNKTVWRNKAIADSYEPGSTFKAISSAAFLEEGLITKDYKVNDNDYPIGGHTIHCWRAAGHGSQEFYKAVWNSCNPVFAKLAVQLGIDKYYKYIEAFGFYDKTGLKFPGEAQSIFHKEPTETDLAVTAFGQRVQVSPIQLAAAYCALANGGELLVPQFVKEIRDSNGNIIQKAEKEVVRQVLSKETCNTMLEILEGVVSEGTGSKAYVAGMRIAGKTGTSETLTTKLGTKDGRYIISFAGIAPADNPEIVCLYIIDHPDVAGSNTGGSSAAPAAGKLMEEILNYLKVERIYSEEDILKKTVGVPALEGKTIADATSALTKLNLKIKVVGDTEDGSVISQMPAAGFEIMEGSSVVVYTSDDQKEQEAEVPDLRGKNIESAFEILNSRNFCMKITNGIGNISSQSVAPGEKKPIGSVITVECSGNHEGAE